MLLAALVIIVKNCKQRKSPLIGELTILLYRSNGITQSQKKKNSTAPHNLDESYGHNYEQKKPETRDYCLIPFVCTSRTGKTNHNTSQNNDHLLEGCN